MRSYRCQIDDLVLEAFVDGRWFVNSVLTGRLCDHTQQRPGADISEAQRFAQSFTLNQPQRHGQIG